MALAQRVVSFEAPYGLLPRFALKANPAKAILRLFAEQGLSFDASTVWEAERVIAAGIPAARVQITAQWLPDEFADLARQGVRVTACSLAHLDRFGRAFPGGDVGVRINPGEGSGGTNRTNVAGPGASFGIWHEHLPEVVRIAETHRLRIAWAHHHVGSGGDPHRWALIAKRTLALLDALPDVATVNLGGGFKVARIEGENESDLAQASHEVGALLRAFPARPGRRLPRTGP